MIVYERFTTVALIFAFSIAAFAQQDDSPGELILYHSHTQVGTVARREFKDEKGRVYKTIYYTLVDFSSRGPFREDQLREQSIDLIFYDESNCRVRSERDDPYTKTKRITMVECQEGTATPKLTTYLDTRGIRERETRHSRTGVTLYFDSEGKKVVAIRGVIPDDADLVNGWGQKTGGLSVGIAINQQRGRQKDMRIYETTKNIDRDIDPRLMISPLEYELKDISGRTVKPKERRYQPETVPDIDGCPGRFGQGAPAKGLAHNSLSIALQDNFHPLPAGKYSFTLKLCVSGSATTLVSNTISFEIID